MRYCLFLFWILAGIGGQAQVATDSLEVPAPSAYGSLLWKIEGDSLPAPSYLFGTMHIIPKDSFFIPPELEQVLDSCTRLVMEIDLNGPSMLKSMMGMVMPPSTSLKKLLSEEDYAYLKTFMKDSLPVSIPMYQMIKPIFISQQVAASYCLQGASESYELYFMQKFNAAGKETSGLETVDEQMAFLDEIPLEEQAAQLMETVRNPGKSCEQVKQMIALYRKQDLGGLLSLIEQDPELADQMGSLLGQRNQNWIPVLEKLMKKEPLFIAVGAGHLPGNEGVIALLLRAGYTVTAVNMKQ